MHPYGGVTKIEGVCENCEEELVMLVRTDGELVPTGSNECRDCETTAFQLA